MATFRELPVGAAFSFTSPSAQQDGYVKRSARGWTHPTYGNGRVGSINAEVIPATPPTQQGAWVAGWNMTGYLPETDPATFETLEQATSYLRGELARWIDQDSDGAIAGPDGAILSDSGLEWTGPYANDPRSAEEIAAEVITTDGATYADGWYGDTHLWAEWSADPSVDQD